LVMWTSVSWTIVRARRSKRAPVLREGATVTGQSHRGGRMRAGIGKMAAPAVQGAGAVTWWGLWGYFKMLVTRAMASPTVSRATADCKPMNALAGRVSGMVSVGLKAVALVRLR